MTWRRSLLLLLVLLPVACSVAAWWLLYTNGGARFVWARVNSALGDTLSAEAIGGAVASGLQLRGFRYTADGVTVSIAEFRGQVRATLFPFELHVSSAAAHGVAVELRPGGAEDGPGKRADRWSALILPFALDVADLEVDGVRVAPGAGRRDITVDRVEVAGEWTEIVRIDRLLLQRGDATLTLRGELGLRDSGPFAGELGLAAGSGFVPRLTRIDATARLDGDLREFRYEADGTLADIALGPLSAAASGTATFRGLEAHSATLTGAAVDASGDGSVSWAGGLEVAVRARLARFDPSALTAEWPANQPVRGELRFAYDPSMLRLDDARLELIDAPGTVSGAGTVNLADGTVTASVTWDALAWPVSAAEPRIASPSGSADVAGHLDAWTADGQLALTAPGLPDGSFRVRANGDRQRAAAQVIEGDVLGGRISGDVSVDTAAGLGWSADILLDRVHTGPITPDWPGVLSGRVRAEGQSDPLRFRAELDGINGRLRDWPIDADGRIALGDSGITADGVVVRHGANELRLDGGLEVPGGLDFAARIDSLANYLDGVDGDLVAQGKLRLEAGEPVGSAQAQSQRIVIDGKAFDDTVLSVDGTREYQVLSFRTRYGEQALEMSLAGSPDDSSAPSEWRGLLSGLSIRDTGEGGREIHLVNSAALQLSRQHVRIEQACLQGAAVARLCVEADWAADRSLDIIADLDSVAVDRVNQFVDTGFIFDQLITGRIRWAKTVGEPLTAFADLVISAGRIRNAERDDLVVRTGDGKLVFDVRDGALLEGRLALPMPGTGAIEGEFSLADVGDLDNSAVNGHFSAVIDDIEVLRILAPLIDEAGGRLTADIDLSGTATAPQFAGVARLQDGVLVYRPLGTRLEELELHSSFAEDGSFELRGDFRAGEGFGTLTSKGSYGSSEAPLTIGIQGKGLRLVDVKDVEAIADTDLEISLEDGIVNLNGNVVVPRARISPRSLPATRYSESGDVVIVAGEVPQASVDSGDSPIRLSGVLAVGLGDDVVVDIDLAKARVTGTARFEWDENLMPLANGRYDIAGDVQAYGQVLRITEGIIRFPNVPANNPTIRIRAEREIFGNSQIKTAGVLVAGTVKRPTVEAYTEPLTTEERALTLLVTGSDFDMEQGVGAIDFGTYIAPKLFVSYGVGLFDRENVISARYDLGKGFGVKATSGQKESGVDLIYRIER